MAIKAWLDGDLRLAIRLLQWANPKYKNNTKTSYKDDNNEFKAA